MTEEREISNQEKLEHSGKKKYTILRNIGNWHHQTSRDERKNLKSTVGEQKATRKKKYIAGTL